MDWQDAAIDWLTIETYTIGSFNAHAIHPVGKKRYLLAVMQMPYTQGPQTSTGGRVHGTELPRQGMHEVLDRLCRHDNHNPRHCWKAYRLIKGLLDLNDNKPMPV